MARNFYPTIYIFGYLSLQEQVKVRTEEKRLTKVNTEN